jgi:putative addiction module killer protein
MFEIRTTAIFDQWLVKLKDRAGRAIIDRRILRLASGNTGDVKSIAKGVSELRIHFGPGYRVYLTQRGMQIVILLCSGDKGSQKRDIARAVEIKEMLEDEPNGN